MNKRISDFFLPDLLEEQHRWNIDQIAFFYETTEEEVINALARANEKYAENPLSANYQHPNSDLNGYSCTAPITPPCGDVPGPPGEDRAQSCEGVVAGGGSP